jgi:hypothetical protein
LEFIFLKTYFKRSSLSTEKGNKGSHLIRRASGAGRERRAEEIKDKKVGR